VVAGVWLARRSWRCSKVSLLGGEAIRRLTHTVAEDEEDDEVEEVDEDAEPVDQMIEELFEEIDDLRMQVCPPVFDCREMQSC
jgi:hypothetical protein